MKPLALERPDSKKVNDFRGILNVIQTQAKQRPSLSCRASADSVEKAQSSKIPLLKMGGYILLW